MVIIVLGFLPEETSQRLAEGQRVKKLAADIVLFDKPDRRSFFDKRVLGVIQIEQNEELVADFEFGRVNNLKSETMLGKIDNLQYASGSSLGKAYIFPIQIGGFAKIPAEF
ncbi:MAG: hypothetical protein KKG47_13825 [Proteobacteria bacterium]|nr:hypothetical protein [Pseudomonadota bacterium]MBU1739088.1 hypothetical protein [Pseudomonadota bacterium]